MSQAVRTRYFARIATRALSARRGEEKNKAPVRSPLFKLFLQCSIVHQVDDHADWSISTTWWWLLDFKKYVYVRTTNSITMIVTEWIFYGLPLFTGFDFWIWLSQDYWIPLSTNQELSLRILFQVLSSKARWMESIYGTKQDCAWELCVNTLKASCEEFVFVVKHFASGFYRQVIQEHSFRTL